MGYFDIDPKIIERAEEIRRKDLKEIERTTKRGSGKKPETLKLYNKYISGDPKTAREYLKDADLRSEVDYIESIILNTKHTIDVIFKINAELKHIAKITSEIFYNPEYEAELIKRVEHYNMVLLIIKTAHNLTDASINTTIKTLDTTNAKIPIELSIAKYVRENYAKKQLRKAVSDAVKDIFPQITDKVILDQIAAKAL